MNEQVCGEPAVAIYVWPTMAVLPCCEKHAAQLRGIADAMGFNLGQLPTAGGETCVQNTATKEPTP